VRVVEQPLAYDDLRDWIKTLEKAGELKRIKEEVSPELEITEITDRVSKIGAGGKPDSMAAKAAAKYSPELMTRRSSAGAFGGGAEQDAAASDGGELAACGHVFRGVPPTDLR